MRALARRLNGVGKGFEGDGFTIPVRQRHLPWRPQNGSSAPRPIAFDGAQCNVVIAIYDDFMAALDEWSEYLRTIVDTASKCRGTDLLIPILFTSDHSSPPALPMVQATRPPTVAGRESSQSIGVDTPGEESLWSRRVVLGLLARMLHKARSNPEDTDTQSGPTRVRIFLSRAKRDGLETPEGVAPYTIETVEYPDPPIGRDERELLSAAYPRVQFRSLSELMA